MLNCRIIGSFHTVERSLLYYLEECASSKDLKITAITQSQRHISGDLSHCPLGPFLFQASQMVKVSISTMGPI